MKSLFALALAITLLIINGCSEQKSNDHVLSSQVDAMNEAKAVTQTIGQNTRAADEEAAQIAGH